MHGNSNIKKNFYNFLENFWLTRSSLVTCTEKLNDIIIQELLKRKFLIREGVCWHCGNRSSSRNRWLSQFHVTNTLPDLKHLLLKSDELVNQVHEM